MQSCVTDIGNAHIPNQLHLIKTITDPLIVKGITILFILVD